jgi:hypothetical protein
MKKKCKSALEVGALHFGKNRSAATRAAKSAAQAGICDSRGAGREPSERFLARIEAGRRNASIGVAI